jgi:hypothetical protein
MDLYLLALAWMSTTTGDGVNSAELWPGGVELSDVDTDGPSKPMTEAYLRSMFRIFAFTFLYGSRVIAEPVSEVSATTFSAMTGVELARSDVQQQQHLLQHEIVRYPLLSPLLTQNHNAALHAIFDGFGSLSLPSSFHDGEDPTEIA